MLIIVFKMVFHSDCVVSRNADLTELLIQTVTMAKFPETMCDSMSVVGRSPVHILGTAD